jgi:preprotein translocase subunit SecE
MIFQIYTRGQGKYTRLCSAAGVAVIVALGCLQLYKKLQAASLGLSPKAALWVATMVPVVLFAVLAAVIFGLVNKPSVADFMIAAEGEMKKVSWSSRKEIAVSTSVVIALVIALAVFLGLTDIIFELFFTEIIGI